MLKEKIEKTKEFVKERKAEIILGGTLAVTVSTLIIRELMLKNAKGIGWRSLDREEKRIMFEIDDIADSIERLDKNAPINKFHKIPVREARINELMIELDEVRKDKSFLS